MRVLCEAEGARCVAATQCVGTPRFAAVSGLNTTLSLGLQAILQLLFNTPQRLPLNEQFRLLAAMLFCLFLAYASLAVWHGFCGLRQPRDATDAEGASPGPLAGRRDYEGVVRVSEASLHGYHRYHDSGANAPTVIGGG